MCEMRSLSWVIGAIAALASAQAAEAQAPTSASTSATGSASVVQPITLVKNSDLAFGSLVRPSLGSNTVTIDPTSGARTLSGTGDASLAANRTASRATYSVAGEGGATFSVTVPSSFTMARVGGNETLPVTLTASAVSGALSGSIGAGGSANFSIGGSLPLSSTTVSGDYTGTFNVTVGYN
jgi:hypothetical protein